jgi:hypothetical protein
MVTAEQHEAVARWLLRRGEASTLPEARSMLDKALAHARGKREAQAGAAKAEHEATGVAVVAEAEKLRAARGADANDYETVARLYEEVDAGRKGSEPGIPSKRSTPVERLERDALVDHQAKAVLAMQGKSLENSCSEREFLAALQAADAQIPALEGGRS